MYPEIFEIVKPFVKDVNEYNIQERYLKLTENEYRFIKLPKQFKIRNYEFVYDSLSLCNKSNIYVNNYVINGGFWRPGNCKPQQKLAILVPYRNRENNLKYFVNYMHQFLQHQNVEYGIFIIEEYDHYSFNRGKLLNMGYIIAKSMYKFDCILLHDIDKLPLNMSIDYLCGKHPTMLIKSEIREDLNKLESTQHYKGYFGGVVNIRETLFKYSNGFNNYLWGYGGEDDDFFKRLKFISKTTPEMTCKAINIFLILNHHNDSKDRRRMFPTNRMSKFYWRRSGLKNIRARLINVIYNDLFTKIIVEL